MSITLFILPVSYSTWGACIVISYVDMVILFPDTFRLRRDITDEQHFLKMVKYTLNYV